MPRKRSKWQKQEAEYQMVCFDVAAKSTRERYHYGFWLQFYLYNDLKDLAGRTNDKALASVIDKAYLQGKWELIK